MKTSLIDSNILLDVFQGGANSAWSVRSLVRIGSTADLLINPVVWSEIAPRFSTEQELSAALAGLSVKKSSLPFSAAFIAGKAHALYRQKGGQRQRTLPDFMIGAHALAEGATLLTRDPSRYRTYFPSLEIIAPDTHP